MTYDELVKDNERLQQWVNDLQSKLYINCVYCGHRAEPIPNMTMADALKQHVLTCPKHPLATAKKLGDNMAKSIRHFNQTRRDGDLIQWLKNLNAQLSAAEEWENQ